MRIKPGVDVSKLSVRGLLILMVLQQLKPSFRLTSGNDGTHMKGSKHYVGDAVDIGSKEFLPEEKRKLISDLKLCLGLDFDVVLEHAGKENEHIHIEYDRKGGPA